jgi:hypothetical protein
MMRWNELLMGADELLKQLRLIFEGEAEKMLDELSHQKCLPSPDYLIVDER